MRQDGVGDAHVAFGVLEIDGVYLVRHSRGANLAGDDALVEVAHRDILPPDITVEVDYDSVYACQCIEHCREVIVVGNLGCRLLASDAESFAQEPVAEINPVDAGIGRARCALKEIAGGATEFSCDRGLGQHFELAREAIGEHFQFLTHCCGRCRLAMGAGKHRILAAAVGKLGDCRMQPAVGWHGNLGKCLGKSAIWKAVLLMSCEVRPKWMNSEYFSRPNSLKWRFRKYSTAFTSWLVTFSISFISTASASEKFLYMPRRRPASSTEREQATGEGLFRPGL